MSMSAPPNQQQPPPLPQPAPLTLKQRLAREAWHWADLPPLRFAGLLLPICVLLFIAPPLPVVAYALWLWASSSWDWRDRWASIWALARRGGVFVSLVLLFAALSSAQVWIFPDLAAALQAFWRAHLVGELSLMPLFEPSLLARTLLLLPLAPLLALYYERIDPRTRVQQQRILTARDMQPKQPKPKQDTPPTQKAAPQEPKARAKPKAKQDAAPREKAEQHSESPQPPPEQITIDSFLASDTDRAKARPASPTRPPAKKQQAEQAETPAPAPSTQIDWSDVAE
jgi:pyruvate/2-oxoglutarate dehydrogenase complex dihydrolipoamide acyltransferase (E2) component